MIGLTHTKVLEEHLIQFIVPVLPRMDDHVIRVAVESVHYSG